MKNLIKQIASVVVVCFVPALACAAWNGAAVENAVLRAQAAHQAAPKMPVLAPAKQKAFSGLLDKAVTVMRQDEVFDLNPAQLGEALLSSVSRVLLLVREERAGEMVELEPEEQRAVYYAIYTLLPAQNRVGLPTFQEYSSAYPVQDWDLFRDAAQESLDLVYQAIEDISQQKPNYRYSWLFFLTH